MNIDDLTIGEARKLAALFSTETKPCANHPATGKYVVVRAYAAGVHVGVLVSAQGGEVHLTDSRRIWSWAGALSCSEIAAAGISGGKVAVTLPNQFVLGAIEIIPASSEAEKCLRNFK